MILTGWFILCVCLPSYAAQRTYIFAAETEHDLKEWKAAMDNCMAKFISGGTISADSHTRLVRTGSYSMVMYFIDNVMLCVVLKE